MKLEFRFVSPSAARQVADAQYSNSFIIEVPGAAAAETGRQIASLA